jgi:xanthine dehydrogenase accessory factor
MHAELLQRAADLARREEPFVLAVVVRRRPASSAQAGDMALVTASGEFHGWLGGSCTQPTVVREARRALLDGQPRLLALTPDPTAPEWAPRPGVAVFPMTCHSGGSVEIYLEPILPAPRLAVFGVSPTARALVKLAKALGYTVAAIDVTAATADDLDPARFPEADQVLAGTAGLAVGSHTALFAVVATMGEGDEEAIRAALALAPSYLGVVASAKRFAQMRQTLLAQGTPEAALAAIRSPAGVSIGAQLPEEIALSVLAEIVERRRAAAPLEPAAAADEAAAQTAEAAEALDPVCGMTVGIAGARHTAEHAGATYYFCGAGCRERFRAAPERFLGASLPGRAAKGAA